MTKSMHTDDRCILCVPHFFLGWLATVANTKTTLMRYLISFWHCFYTSTLTQGMRVTTMSHA